MRIRLGRMNKELSLVENPKSNPTSRRYKSRLRNTSATAPKPTIDICEISANALHFNMKRPDTEFFQTSLYEIDRILEDRTREEEDRDTLELIRQKLLKCFIVFKNAFSKSASNRLLPYRVYNHKI